MRYLATLSFCFCAVASAQDSTSLIRIQATSANGSRISGALVALVNPQGQVVAEGMTDANGGHLLKAAPGKYKVRLRRIGFAPYFSDEVSIPRAEPFTIVPDEQRILLQTVVVTSSTSCDRNNNRQGIATIWEEISKALAGTRLTRSDMSNAGSAYRYDKRVLYAGGVISSDTVRTTIAGNRPFEAAKPEWLASTGYVHGDISSGWQYFAPDEVVLLSPEFAQTHCFAVVRNNKRHGQVGLKFDPAPRRRTADIAGTLWLNEKSSELIEMEFHYVNLGVVTRFKPGGRVHFMRMPSGAWLVDNWMLQFPQLERRIDVDEPLVQVGYAEQGGSIVSESVKSIVGKSVYRVRGEVFDSVTEKPLNAARVFIGAKATSTNENGRFELLSVDQGPQTIAFSHPSLEALGFVAIERSIEVTSDSDSVFLATPSLKSLWQRVCNDSNPDVPVNERGIVHGFVYDKSGKPVENARVEFIWMAYMPTPGERTNAIQRSMVIFSDNRGHYAACGFRLLANGDVVASTASAKSTAARFSFDKSLLVRRDLVIPLTH